MKRIIFLIIILGMLLCVGVADATTKFYLNKFNASGTTPNAKQSSDTIYDDFANTTSNGTYANPSLMSTGYDDLYSETTSSKAESGSNHYNHIGSWITEPLTSQTLSGTISLNAILKETNNNANFYPRIYIYKWNANDTKGSDILARTNSSTEAPSSFSEQNYFAGTAITTTTINEGDRVVLEFEGSNTNTKTTTYSQGIRTANLNTNSSITFSDDLTFFLPPVASFTGTPIKGAAPLSVNFTDESTNTPTNWDWYWYANETKSSDSQNPTFSFPIGNYSVRLWASNGAGGSWKNQTNYITAGEAVVPAFSANVTSGSSPLSVAFTDASTGNATSWGWNFGDQAYQSWINTTKSPEWVDRQGATAVALSDDSILLMGGFSASTGSYIHEVWKSTDRGLTWTLINSSPGWTLYGPASVRLPNGKILLMAGEIASSTYTDDVWQSSDNGSTWSLVTGSPGWTARSFPAAVALSDNSVVLIGGGTSGGYRGDVWRSTDNGSTWTNINWSLTNQTLQRAVATRDDTIVLMGGSALNSKTMRSTDMGYTWQTANASSGWAARWGHLMEPLPDGSILIGGGYNSGGLNDVWRSADNGTTWTQIDSSAEWTARYLIADVSLSDGSTVIMGGGGGTNQTWRSVSSTTQSPTNIFTGNVGNKYNISLIACNAMFCDEEIKLEYITISEGGLSAPVAAFTVNRNPTRIPKSITFTDTSTNTPTAWNWSFGDGTANSTSQNPVHIYTKRGRYLINLTATNAAGNGIIASYVRVVGYENNY